MKIYKTLGYITFFVCSAVRAEIAFDHSAVVPLALQGQKLSGAMQIPASSGTQRGGNLLHSFETFHIRDGESATFTPNGATAPINNVIGRVTGGEASIINGTLKSTIDNANLYLINPNGWILGKKAQLSIPAAFHLSTASSLKFTDGEFRANNTAFDHNVLTLTAPPEAFGFLNAAQGAISLQGSQLVVVEGQTLDLSAANLKMTDGVILQAPAGEVRLVALKGDTTLGLTSDKGALPLPHATEYSGQIDIEKGTGIDVSGDGGGRFSLSGGDVLFKDSLVYADNAGSTPPTNIKGLIVNANSLTLENNTILTFDALDVGNAGAVTINANKIAVMNGSYISSNTFALGSADSVTIHANELNVDSQNNPNFTGIVSNAEQGSQGNAGTLNITANTMSVVNGGEISSTTFAKGNAGSVIIKTDELNVNRQNNPYFTGIASNAGQHSQGNAGVLRIFANNMALLNGGEVVSSTFAKGDAGHIKVNTETLVIDGQRNSTHSTGIFSRAELASSGKAGTVTVNADNLTIVDAGAIDAVTFSSGKGGDIVVTAKNLAIDGKNYTKLTGISSDAEAHSSGQAGLVKVITQTLRIDNNGRISSLTLPTSTGNAGDVTVTATDDATINHGSINSSSLGNGLGGNVSVNAPQLTLDNVAEITALSSSQAQSGNVAIHTQQFNLNDSQVTAVNIGEGAAGKIDIHAADSFHLNHSAVTVEAAQGDAGDIHIQARNILHALRSEITTSAGGGKGNGGNIYIDQQIFANRLVGKFVVLNKSQVIANAQERGDAGNISIFPKTFLQSVDSKIQASSPLGAQGTITITGANSNIAGSIAALLGSFIDTENAMQDSCNKRRNVETSSSFNVQPLHNVVLSTPDNASSDLPAALPDCRAVF